MPFKEIARRPVLDQVAEQLRDAVVEALAGAGELPNEGELARALTVSRPTVREALRILEAEGLVNRDGRTAGVRADARPAAMSRPLRQALLLLTRIDRIGPSELMNLRIAIQEKAAEEAARVATPEDLSAVQAVIDAERTAATTSEQSWGEASFQFHVAIVEASHNGAFLLVMSAAQEAMTEFIMRALNSGVEARDLSGDAIEPASSSPPEESVEQRCEAHQEILDAFRAHQGKKAARLVANRIRAFYEPPIAVIEELRAKHERASSTSTQG